VEARELGKASGINYMAQQLGRVFAIAIGTSVFAAYGHLGTPASVTDGFQPALIACTVFAALAALTAIAITAPKKTQTPVPEAVPDASTVRSGDAA
jgi:hypothetical protein